jgi:tRNA A37 methylthiotransferase MiaB
MRRFGSSQSFLELIDQVRARAPLAGIRSNVIVGFPGETQQDLDELEAFLTAARLDVVGVFGYSDEDGTEAETLGGKFDKHEIADRLAHFTTLVEELNIQRAEERIGERIEVLVEGIDEDDADEEFPGELTGRAAHQGPDVDGATILRLRPGAQPPAVGQIITATVLATEGIDLIAEPG